MRARQAGQSRQRTGRKPPRSHGLWSAPVRHYQGRRPPLKSWSSGRAQTASRALKALVHGSANDRRDALAAGTRDPLDLRVLSLWKTDCHGSWLAPCGALDGGRSPGSATIEPLVVDIEFAVSTIDLGCGGLRLRRDRWCAGVASPIDPCGTRSHRVERRVALRGHGGTRVPHVLQHRLDELVIDQPRLHGF